MKRVVCFEGEIAGDCECFVWLGTSEADRVAVVGSERQEQDRRDEIQFHKEFAEEMGQPYDPAAVDNALRVIYPDTVCDALGVERGKKYRFVVTAEEI